jgi:hypothetical protein
MEGSCLPGFIEIYLEGLRKTTKIEDNLCPGRPILDWTFSGGKQKALWLQRI